MKQQVIFIHGGSSYSKRSRFLDRLRTLTLRDLPGMPRNERWTDTLAEDLGVDFELFAPSMPNKQNADYEEWKIWLERYLEHIHDGVIMIGWSLGGIFLAKYLCENDSKFRIKSLYLLAAPAPYFVDETGDDCGNFRFPLEELSKLEEKVGDISLWHSHDDPVVSYENVDKYKKLLKKARIVEFFDQNHFLLPKFTALISDIKKH